MQGVTFHLLQIVAGIVVAGFAYALSLVIVQRQRLVSALPGESYQPKQRVDILKGYLDAGTLAYTSYNTVDPFANGTYVNLQRSHNRIGGAQFTYQFWMFLADTTERNVRDKDILLRGDMRRYNFYHKANRAAMEDGPREDVVVKCPRIRFGRTFKDIVVEFNSHDKVLDWVIMGSDADPTDTSMRHNIMSMMQNKWAMFTFTFEDNVPINDFENGLLIRMYVNDILYYTQRKRTTLRLNVGNLYLFPSGEINACRLGGLKYFNYAISLDEVRKIFSRGRPRGQQVNTSSSDSTGSAPWARSSVFADPAVSSPAYLTAYNKVDLYNR